MFTLRHAIAPTQITNPACKVVSDLLFSLLINMAASPNNEEKRKRKQKTFEGSVRLLISFRRTTAGSWIFTFPNRLRTGFLLLFWFGFLTAEFFLNRSLIYSR
jgi:hypothetical protein